MDYLSEVSAIAEALQFVVAIYALRLTRLFGAVKVGWSLFCAFSLLALVHIIQFVTPDVDVSSTSAMKIEVMYAMVSMLLLMGMMHMESLLKERQQTAQQEKRIRAELEEEVKKKTAHLSQAVFELQAEIDRRTRVEAQVEKSNTELLYASQQVKAAESVNTLMHNMVEMLKSVNVSASLVADHMRQSKIAKVVGVGNLVREHARDLREFMSRDPRGQELPQYVALLAEHLDNEQAQLTRELDTIRKSLEEIVAMEQNHTRSTWGFKSKDASLTSAAIPAAIPAPA
jgi:hypothetical protein